MSRINQLTPEQVAQLSVYRDRWTRIGLCCEPLDFEAAKLAATRAYNVVGLAAPSLFLRMQSPLSAALAAALLNVRAQVWAQVGAQVWAQVSDQVSDQVRAQVFGAHDAGWLSFYAYMLDVCGLACCETLMPLIDLAQHCGWWAPYREVCILQDRHCELHRDERGRLHNPNGMAVKYPDGFGVYAYNGVRLPVDRAEEILAGRVAVPDILTEPNAELKRVMIEITGWDKVLMESHARLLNSYEGKSGNVTLYALNIGDTEAKLLQMFNDTPEPDGSHKPYVLRVPPHITDAKSAMAWTWGMSADEYSPVVES